MQLPQALRQAIDRELHGIALADLGRAAEALSRRYRAETRDGRFHLHDDLAARAYLATRMPATFAAISSSLAAVGEALPDFRPNSVLDVGAGPGTATWAAVSTWDSVVEVDLIEAGPAIRAVGERLSSALPLTHVAWRGQWVDGGLPDRVPADLVIMAYVLDELEPSLRAPLIARLWELTGATLVIVEPGTTLGWRRILAAREQLIGAGAHILAPCPHAKPCPLSPPDWCHFAARVARSRLHRQAKGGSVPWEDEKFIYLAASRGAPEHRVSRVLAPPRVSKAGVTLKLCEPDGAEVERLFAKRDGGAKAVHRLGWGDTLPIASG